jgi:hypothetical protein
MSASPTRQRQVRERMEQVVALLASGPMSSKTLMQKLGVSKANWSHLREEMIGLGVIAPHKFDWRLGLQRGLIFGVKLTGKPLPPFEVKGVRTTPAAPRKPRPPKPRKTSDKGGGITPAEFEKRKAEVDAERFARLQAGQKCRKSHSWNQSDDTPRHPRVYRTGPRGRRVA